MTNWQTAFVSAIAFIAIAIAIKGLYESIKKKNSFKVTPYLFPLGIFVWADATVIGLFWMLFSLVSLILKDWILFLLFVSVYWVVRSLGETIYWLNQQFSKINRNPPEKMYLYKFIKNDSVWFIYQIFWQCITVVSFVFTIYFAKIWFLS